MQLLPGQLTIIKINLGKTWLFECLHSFCLKIFVPSKRSTFNDFGRSKFYYIMKYKRIVKKIKILLNGKDLFIA